MINPFTGIPTVDKKLTPEDKDVLLNDDKWIFELASKLNIPGAAGGGAPFDLADHTTDELPEGSTNLYSQWEVNTYTNDFLQPKTTTQGLVVGNNLHSSVSTAFNAVNSVFNGDPLAQNGGINYFVNLAYGTGFSGFGGLFVGGRANGSPGTPTQTLDSNWTAGYTSAAFTNANAWEISGANHILPGLYFMAAGNVTTGSYTPDIYIGGLITRMITLETDTNAIKFNEAQLDSDITFYWDSGASLVLDGGTGNVTAGNLSATTANTLANIDTAQTFTNKRITPRVSTTTSSATPTINTDNVDMYGLTAQTADITSFTTNLSGTPTNGQKLWIYIVGTAARAITWGASFENGPSTLPTTTVGTERLDVGFVWNAVSSKWRCVSAGSA